jgi:hypothetical protein
LPTVGRYTRSLFAVIFDLWFKLWVLGNPLISRPDLDGIVAARHSWEMWEPCFAVESQPVVIRRTSNKHLEAAAGGLGLFCLSAQHSGLLRLQRLQLLHLHERAPRKLREP